MLKTAARYFVAVAESGSFRGASETMHVAQSAISRQIQALEAEFGVALFDRHPRGVALTAAGEIVLRFVRNEVHRFDRVKSEIDALLGLRRGHVDIASVETLVPQVLPRAIDRFRLKHPGVNFNVEIAGTDQVVACVREARVDVGLGFGIQPANDLSIVFSRRIPLYAAMAADHPLADAESVSVRDLADWPVALPPQWTGSRQAFDLSCREAGVAPTLAMETNSVELMHRFALLGHGITVLAELVIKESVRSGQLKAIPFSDPSMNAGTVDAVTFAMRVLPLAAEEFLRYLHDELDARLPKSG